MGVSIANNVGEHFPITFQMEGNEGQVRGWVGGGFLHSLAAASCTEHTTELVL